MGEGKTLATSSRLHSIATTSGVCPPILFKVVRIPEKKAKQGESSFLTWSDLLSDALSLAEETPPGQLRRRLTTVTLPLQQARCSAVKP